MTAFARALAALIARDGPIRVERFMEMSLSHYYGTRDPFGAAGDFTTAPEISQMFGELLALFLVQSWRDQGAPAPVLLVELGPGRGTLMSDLRRTLAKAAPDLARAAQIHLVETSAALRAAQETRLGPDLHWHETLATVPEGPLLLIANEFFDALPVRQVIRSENGWAERCVGLGADGRFIFMSGAHIPMMDEAPLGTIFETCPKAEAIMRDIARRIMRHGGVALLIDYGHPRTAYGETLQAVMAHRYADPLAAPGESDLTTHVDFDALAHNARLAGAACHGPVEQAAFLEALGLALRTEKLKRASPADAPALDAARHRLTAPDQMGSLFKAMAITRPSAPPLAGFPA